MESPWDGGTKVCSNGPGHMTKMAAMSIYSKNLKKSSSLKPKGRRPWNLGARVLLSLFKWWPWIDLDLFYGKVKFGILCFVWEKGKTMHFSETIVVCDLKLAIDDRSDKKFLLTSKLCPLGDVCPLAPGLYTCIKSWKNCIKSDFEDISLKLATNG